VSNYERCRERRPFSFAKSAIMTFFRFSTNREDTTTRPGAGYRSVATLFAAALFLSAAPLSAQGIVDMVVPHEGVNSETAAYHAKVRNQIASMLQSWAKAVERGDSAALAGNYTPNAHSIIGREPEGATPLGIASQIFSTGLGSSHIDVTVEDFDMSGDMAFVSAVLIAPSSTSDTRPVFVQSLFVLRFDDWKQRWQIREQFIDWRRMAQ
jgi:ketosteroid isomerase-like protein